MSGLKGRDLDLPVTPLHKPEYGYMFAALTDIEVRALSTANSQTLETEFHIVLVPV